MVLPSPKEKENKQTKNLAAVPSGTWLSFILIAVSSCALTDGS